MSKDYRLEADKLYPDCYHDRDVIAILLQKIDELEREKEALLIHDKEFETSWRELTVKVKELEAENARLVASIKPSEYYSVLGSEFIRFLKWGEGEDNG